MAGLVVKYAHFVGFMLLFASLVGEHLLIKPVMSRAGVRHLAKVDVLFSIGAATVFITGLLLVLVFGKPTEFYLSNWVFYLKVALLIPGAINRRCY